jgi:hypothetical protein
LCNYCQHHHVACTLHAIDIGRSKAPNEMVWPATQRYHQFLFPGLKLTKERHFLKTGISESSYFTTIPIKSRVIVYFPAHLCLHAAFKPRQQNVPKSNLTYPDTVYPGCTTLLRTSGRCKTRTEAARIIRLCIADRATQHLRIYASEPAGNRSLQATACLSDPPCKSR